MSKIIAILLLLVSVVSCTTQAKDEKKITIGKDKFDLVQTKAIVVECERIASVSVHDDINPRYRIVTADSMKFKSSGCLIVGDTIDVRVYKKRK